MSRARMRVYPVVKRVLDVVISGVGLVVAAPVMGAVAVAIRWKLGAPVLFRQLRPGLRGELFELVKFRTMYPPVAGEREIDRMTKLGRLLRSTSLDELPTLWNVLRGDMSIVGPRPLLPAYLPRYSPIQARRHEVRPGITGLAQVRGRNALSWEEKFAADVEYVDGLSAALDIRILLATVTAVLSRRGISASELESMPEFMGTESQTAADAASTAAPGEDRPALVSDRDLYPDVYFTPGYGVAARDAGFESWCSISRFEGRWQMPLVIRRIPGGGCDAASPYGYSGVYASEDLTDAQVAQAWESTIQELRDRELVSVFLRHSPLVPQARAHRQQISLIADHPTLAVPVQAEEGMWAAVASSCQRQIKKATRAGLTAGVRVVAASDLAEGGTFRTLYESTMRRREASPFYFFDDQYYARLHAALGDDLHLAEVRDPDGGVLSACLLMTHGRFLHYHLAGSDPDGARYGANNLMMWEACRFARAQGVELFHLGGGLHAEDSLHRFKSSFGGVRLRYRTSGLILDEAKYAELAGPESAGDFFPSYRRPAR